MMHHASNLTSASAATLPTYDATLILDEVLDEILVDDDDDDDGGGDDDGFAPDSATLTSIPGPSISIPPMILHNEDIHPPSPSTSRPQDPPESEKDLGSGNNDEDDDDFFFNGNDNDNNNDNDNDNDNDNENDEDENLGIDTGMHDGGGGGGSGSGDYDYNMDDDAPSAPHVPQDDTLLDFDIEFDMQHHETLTPLEQQLQDADAILNDAELNTNHPMILSNPNPMSLGPENPGVLDFLRHWIWQGQRSIPRAMTRVPFPRQVRHLAKNSPGRITYDDLTGDEYDFQGINWKMLGISRNLARNRRHEIYSNYVNRRDSDVWLKSYPDRSIATLENYFRFRMMDIRNDVRLLHFQLRNIFGCSSRMRVFYPSYGTVQQVNPLTGANKVAMKFDSDADAQISTLAATEDILLVGSFYGDYRYRSLNTSAQDPELTEGRLTDHISGITNHVQIYSSRHSSAPLAAFASNDFGFRLVDLTTNKIISEFMYDFAMNCSTLSPDARLRIMVGDQGPALITDAETGEILQRLHGHRDFGFACDWAADGWTVATGNQDKTIRIWDARNWQEPVTVIRTEMSGARSLRFSPLGSGKRVLIAAEEADYIHAIDAQNFLTKQTFDLFGELGGISFANDGQDLMALSCDPHRGGLLQLERCDAGAYERFDNAFDSWWTPGCDWLQSPEEVAEAPGSLQMLPHHRRRAAMMAYFEPF